MYLIYIRAQSTARNQVTARAVLGKGPHAVCTFKKWKPMLLNYRLCGEPENRGTLSHRVIGV